MWDYGPDRLADYELLALVLGTGSRDAPVALLAAQLVAEVGSMVALSRALPGELALVRGIGPARAAQLAACFELGRRAMHGQAVAARTLGSAHDVAARLTPRFAGLMQEVFVALAIDVRGGVLAELEIARGQLSGVEVHPRELFRPLIRLGAAGVVVAHNHPSGDPTPSPEDILLTGRLREVGQLVGIPLIDHVVIAGDQYQSIAEWHGAESERW